MCTHTHTRIIFTNELYLNLNTKKRNKKNASRTLPFLQLPFLLHSSEANKALKAFEFHLIAFKALIKLTESTFGCACRKRIKDGLTIGKCNGNMME